MRRKKLSPTQELNVEHEIRMLLHAGRDCMRNQKRDTTLITFDVNNPYYGEAFGIMRALALLGYGKLDSATRPDPDYEKWNLRWWLDQIQQAVLREEGFGGTNQCDYCFLTYGKDALRSRRKETA